MPTTPERSNTAASQPDEKKKKKGFLGRMKKKSGDGSPVRKTKFKKIKGLLRGDSKTKSPVKQPTPTPNIEDDNSSTAYNVDVDERSIASTSTATRTDTSGSLLGKVGEGSLLDKKRLMLKVVLLLMDPKSRRFELLQLEFDSKKAMVADVLAQIPLSATETSLKEQVFASIVGKNGYEMTKNQLLSEYCSGNEVLVAVPKGSNAKDCSRLARPILGDDKVISMLKSSGIDASEWKDLRKRKSTKNRSTPSKPRSAVSTPRQTTSSRSTKKKTSVPWAGIIFWVFIFAMFGAAHWYMSSPVKRGERVLPGVWKSRCGLLPFDPECENEYMMVGFDGTVTSYDKDFKEKWRLSGGVCGNDQDCVPGLVMTPKGDIRIGGERVLYMDIIQSGVNLDSGFPFATKPRVKRN